MQRRDEILSANRIHRRLLESPVRARVYQRIVHVPGIHLRRLVRDLGLAMGTVEHHLRLLERHGLVLPFHGARRKTYFARENVDPADIDHLHALRNRTWRTILLELLAEPDLSFGELAARLPCTASTAAYHLRRLQGMRLLERTSVGRNVLYRLRDGDRVGRLLEAYRPTYRGLQGDRQLLHETPPAESTFEHLVRRIPPPREQGPWAPRMPLLIARSETVA